MNICRSVILTEFGDTSAVEQRKQFFDEVDTESSGAIDFMDFITVGTLVVKVVKVKHSMHIK